MLQADSAGSPECWNAAPMFAIIWVRSTQYACYQAHSKHIFINIS